MVCPQGCPTPLVIAERQGVEIDYCPTCRGVWLDRGELDKIIERAAAFDAQSRPAAPAPQAPGVPPIPQAPVYAQPRRDYDDDRYDDYKHKKRKKGFLGELFDFD